MHVPVIFPSPACCTLVLPTALSTRQVTKAAAKAVVLCHHSCSSSHCNRHTSFAPSAKISQGCRPFHNGLELVAFGIGMELNKGMMVLTVLCIYAPCLFESQLGASGWLQVFRLGYLMWKQLLMGLMGMLFFYIFLLLARRISIVEKNRVKYYLTYLLIT